MPTAQLLTPGGKLRTVLLTREHSASSYGLPVVVVDGMLKEREAAQPKAATN